jgi:ketosteroid isomerase-like protein
MTDLEVQDFVTRFAAAWALRDSQAFLDLWHPDGLLHTPLLERPLPGRDLGRLNEAQKQAAPDVVWQLLDWSHRGDRVVIEWQCSRQTAAGRYDWRGVDCLRLREGRITEERVYMDTAPLRALRSGAALEPIMRL